MNTDDLKVEFTDAVKAWVDKNATREEMQEKTKAAIEDLECTKVSDLILHTFTWSGSYQDDSQAFVLTPIGEDALQCDLSDWVEHDVAAGPFKSAKIEIPKPSEG